MNLDPYLIPCTKLNSKCIKHLNVRPKAIKGLGKHVGQKLHDSGFVSDFLDVTLKPQATKGKSNNCISLAFLKLSTTKDNVNN